MAQTQTLIPLSTQALDNILQVSICVGRVQIVYSYGCYGYTRGSGSTWHGGLDLVCLDDTTIRMPYYTAADGTRRAIKGTVVTARIVTDHTNLTWEWGVLCMCPFGRRPDPRRSELPLFLPLQPAAG